MPLPGVLQMTGCRLKELARHDRPQTRVPNFVPAVPEYVPQPEITACQSKTPGGSQATQQEALVPQEL